MQDYEKNFPISVVLCNNRRLARRRMFRLCDRVVREHKRGGGDITDYSQFSSCDNHHDNSDSNSKPDPDGNRAFSNNIHANANSKHNDYPHNNNTETYGD